MTRYGRAFPAAPIVVQAVLPAAQSLALTATGTSGTTGTLDVNIQNPLTLTSAGFSNTSGSLAVGGANTLSATGAAASTGSGALAWLTQISATGASTSGGSVDVTFPVTTKVPKSVSGRKVLDQNGAQIKIKTRSAWGMPQNAPLTGTDLTDWLDDVRAAGENSVTIAMFGGHYDATWDRYKDAAGNDAWGAGVTPWAAANVSQLGPAWNTILAILDLLDDRGMFANLSLYTGFNSDNGIVADLTAVTTTQAQNCGAAIATKLAGRDNYIWHCGIDSGTYPKANINAFFKGVRTVESPPRLLWYEPDNGNSTDDMGMGDAANGWPDAVRSFNSRYTYGPNAVVDTDTVYAQTSEPVIDSEPPYVGAGHYTGSSGAPNTTERQQLRERKWCGYIRGEIGINTGHEMEWPFGKPGLFTVSGVTWQSAPSTTPMIQLGYPNYFVDRYFNDATWVPSAFITGGIGTGDSKAGGGNSDVAAVAYFPDSRGSVTVDTTLLSGTGNVRLQWLDPTLDPTSSGSYTTIASSEAQNSSRAVTMPGTNADGANDWVLLVTLVSSPLSATGAASSSGSGAVNMKAAITASGTSTSTGSLAANATTTLTATGASATTGSLAVGGANTLASTGTSATTGSLAVVRATPLTATGTSTSTGSVDATISNGATSYALAATGAAVSSGSLAVPMPGAMTATGSSTSTGSLALMATTTATASGTSTSTGSANAQVALSVTATGTATTTGSADATITPPAPPTSLASQGFSHTDGSLNVDFPGGLSATGGSLSSGVLAFVTTYTIAAIAVSLSSGRLQMGINGQVIPVEAFDHASVWGWDPRTIVGD